MSERAHRAITGLIHSHELRGGELVLERHLAERLGISRTPLREALQRLEGEGLLVKNANRSYSVRYVDLAEYLQSLKTREVLECEAAQLAAGRIPPDRLREVRDEIEELRTSSKYHTEGHWRSDDNVHNLFADHCGNAVMARLIRGLRGTNRLFEIAGLAERVDPDSTEHLAILDALQAGDGRAARKAVSTHIRSLIRYSLVDLTT
ncbi:MAG: GntR family transcriptional regulator [Geminicoccaceae bacterium]